MKKITLLLLILSSFRMIAQDIATGVGGTLAGAALITTYFIKTNNETRSLIALNESRGRTASASQIRSSVRKENLPFLLVGAGCGIMAVAAFAEKITIFKGKKGDISGRVSGEGITVAYNFR